MQCLCNITLGSVRATIVAVDKAMSITCYECVFVALGIQQAVLMRRIVICGLSGCTIFFQIVS